MIRNFQKPDNDLIVNRWQIVIKMSCKNIYFEAYKVRKKGFRYIMDCLNRPTTFFPAFSLK